MLNLNKINYDNSLSLDEKDGFALLYSDLWNKSDYEAMKRNPLLIESGCFDVNYQLLAKLLADFLKATEKEKNRWKYESYDRYSGFVRFDHISWLEYHNIDYSLQDIIKSIESFEKYNKQKYIIVGNAVYTATKRAYNGLLSRIQEYIQK